MPLFNFACSGCSFRIRKFGPTAAKAISGMEKCPRCGGTVSRDPNPPGSSATERLDNGFMVKAIERHPEAERLYRERSQNDPRLKPE